MKRQERKEDAASPVIGVMLMLVVTVVIAAVITGFATDMAGESTATTPMALLEADNLIINSGSCLETFDIVHKGGDEIVLENIQITIEPIGGNGYGILNIRNGNNPDHLKILGGSDTVVSTGERIRVQVDGVDGGENDNVVKGGSAKWIVYDTRTTGIIAKGELIVE